MDAVTGSPRADARILRVAGPLVELEYTGDTAMNDLVSSERPGCPARW